MKIIVCIKQVPDTNEVKLDPVTGTLIREGVPSIINPDDKAGLEAALALKDQYGAHVTIVSMGPPQADLALREALAMGADEAILVTDRAFGGADTWNTISSSPAVRLSMAIRLRSARRSPSIWDCPTSAMPRISRSKATVLLLSASMRIAITSSSAKCLA